MAVYKMLSVKFDLEGMEVREFVERMNRLNEGLTNEKAVIKNLRIIDTEEHESYICFGTFVGSS